MWRPTGGVGGEQVEQMRRGCTPAAAHGSLGSMSGEATRHFDQTADLATYAPTSHVVRRPQQLLRRIASPRAQGERQQHLPGVTQEDRASTQVDVRLSRRRRPRFNGSRRAFWLVVATSLVLAAIAALAGAVVALPSATIRIAPVIEERSLVLTYGIIAGDGVDWVAPTRAVSVVVQAEAELPASGEKQVPEGFASGKVRAVNAAIESVRIPAGTELVGTNGIRYRITTDVTVPAADPFGSQAFGVADLPVVATTPGPDGNAAVGVVSGQLGTGLLYRNVEPISGGTMRTVHFVTEEDLARLRAAVEQSLARQVPEELHAALQEGEVLVDGTIQSAPPVVEFSHQVNAETERVSARGSMRVSAFAYNPATVHQAAQEEAARRLAQATSPDDVILGNTLTFGEPESLGSNRWRVRATAKIRIVPSERELETVRNELTGKSVEDAIARIRAIPGVAAVSIELRPSWWPSRMPDRSSRIEVVFRE
ncbi:hypothetical protein HRbin28_02395 [bacterium HR28]|nr:hypothetical protein HRbin28_02395 [bacterium HR28]